MLRQAVARRTFGFVRVFARGCANPAPIGYAIPCDTAPPISASELSSKPFPPEVTKVLNNPIDSNEIEIKPDGILYFPEIRYRRILNNAFGQGGWAMIPRGPPIVKQNYIFREYAMFCYGNFVSQAIGEQTIAFMDQSTAIESAKSTALMRCCKDLGIASELWDPTFIQEWKKQHGLKVWCLNEKTNKKSILWRRKDRSSIQYPWVEQSPVRDDNEPRQYQSTSPPPQTNTQSYNSPKPVTPPPPPPQVQQQPPPPKVQSPPPPQFQPPPPQAQQTQGSQQEFAAQAQQAVQKPSFPTFSLPPGHSVAQQGTPKTEPAQPTKVNKHIQEDIDLSLPLPDEIVSGTEHVGKTWKQMIDEQETRDFLSQATTRPLSFEHRHLITNALRMFLANRK